MRDVSGLDGAFVEQSIARRRGALALPTVGDYLERLASDPSEADELLRLLDVHHSELFRDPYLFAIIEQRLLPELADAVRRQGRKELRVWSAGCAAGQEAYSVAIVAAEQAEASGGGMGYRVFGTDHSETEIARAREGVFCVGAMRNVRLGHLARWFEPSGAEYVVSPRIRERVDFSVHELLDPLGRCPTASIFGTFDLVVCCNVLLYYDAPSRQRILRALRRWLAPEGYLVTSTTERDLVLEVAGLRLASPAAGVFQREG